MCDRWTSICRSQPFSEPAILFWASDTRRHPSCSDGSLCQNIWARRTKLAEKGTAKPLENTPWGESKHRCIVSVLISHFSHSDHHTVLFHTHPQTAWCHSSSLPCLYLYHAVNPSIGSVLLLAHGDAHLSMKEFILAANHSRGVVIKYRCANTLMSLMHCGERSHLNQYWSFK